MIVNNYNEKNQDEFLNILHYFLDNRHYNEVLEIGKSPPLKRVWIEWKNTKRIDIFSGNTQPLYERYLQLFGDNPVFLGNDLYYRFRNESNKGWDLEQEVVSYNVNELFSSQRRRIVTLSSSCDFFGDLTIIPRHSKSLSVQAIAKVPDQKQVFLKISFREDILKNRNELWTEASIYMNVINRLFYTNSSPHVVICYAILYCNPPTIIEKELDQLKKYIEKKRLNDYYNTSIIQYLVLEKVRGNTLEHIISSGPMPFDLFWLPVLFQILYTLECFWAVGLQHNDLHLGNIFVEVGKNITVLNYKTRSGQLYRMNTPYFVKIFDFDRSTKFSTPLDPLVLRNSSGDSHCHYYGECNYPNSRTDVFKILYLLYFIPNLKTFCKRFADSVLLKMPPCDSVLYGGKFVSTFCWAHAGNLCHLQKDDTYQKSACSLYNEDGEDTHRIASPSEILESEYFSPYRIEKEDGDVFSLK
jgi:hypothetical protein